MRRSLIAAALLVLAAACTATTPSPSASPAAPRAADRGYDVVIEGGRIVDGTGNAWYPGDVGIVGDRIVAITPAGSTLR